MKYKTINELGEVISGSTPRRNIEEYWNGNISWVSIKDVSNLDNQYIKSTKEKITEKGYKSCSTKLVPKGTLLVTSRAPIGHLAIADLELCTNQGFKNIVPNKGTDSLYLYYAFKHNIERLKSIGTGATFKEISKEKIEKFKLPFPDTLSDQKRIAKVLSDCEQLIAWRKESIQLLDDYLESVFWEMFGDPSVNPKGFQSKVLSEFYIDKKNGTKCGPFGSALKKHEYVESGIPVWNMDNISKKGKFIKNIRLWITEDKFEQLKGYSAENGDIIISRAGTVGKMCVLNSQYSKSIISTNLIRLRLDTLKLLPEYFTSLMIYCKGRVGRLKTGPDGGFTHMNTGILDKLRFPYPPIDLQRKFKSILEDCEVQKKNLNKSLFELKNLYSSISKIAFKGELDLSKILVDEEVEPAQSPEETTVVNTEKEEQPSLKKAATKPKGKRDIRNMYSLDYLGIPEELYNKNIDAHFAPELKFISDDLFYQFYLKDNFADQTFTFSDLHQKFGSYYIPKGQDFEPRTWKSILYKFMEGNKPLVEQIFDKTSGTIKLKLTDEAFKA